MLSTLRSIPPRAPSLASCNALAIVRNVAKRARGDSLRFQLITTEATIMSSLTTSTDHVLAPSACPWCGCGGGSFESFAGVRLVLCTTCDLLASLAAGGASEPVDDDEFLEDTAEYDIIHCGPATYRIERVREK